MGCSFFCFFCFRLFFIPFLCVLPSLFFVQFRSFFLRVLLFLVLFIFSFCWWLFCLFSFFVFCCLLLVWFRFGLPWLFWFFLLRCPARCCVSSFFRHFSSSRCWLGLFLLFLDFGFWVFFGWRFVGFFAFYFLFCVSWSLSCAVVCLFFFLGSIFFLVSLFMFVLFSFVFSLFFLFFFSDSVLSVSFAGVSILAFSLLVFLLVRAVSSLVAFFVPCCCSC